MKLYDLAMKLGRHDIPVVLVDKKSRRIAFEGDANGLLDYSGLDYRKITSINVLDETLFVEIR